MSGLDEQTFDFPKCGCRKDSLNYWEGIFKISGSVRRGRMIFLDDDAPILKENESPKIFYFHYGSMRHIPNEVQMRNVKNIKCGYCQKVCNVELSQNILDIALKLEKRRLSK